MICRKSTIPNWKADALSFLLMYGTGTEDAVVRAQSQGEQRTSVNSGGVQHTESCVSLFSRMEFTKSAYLYAHYEMCTRVNSVLVIHIVFDSL